MDRRHNTRVGAAETVAADRKCQRRFERRTFLAVKLRVFRELSARCAEAAPSIARVSATCPMRAYICALPAPRSDGLLVRAPVACFQTKKGPATRNVMGQRLKTQLAPAGWLPRRQGVHFRRRSVVWRLLTAAASRPSKSPLLEVEVAHRAFLRDAAVLARCSSQRRELFLKVPKNATRG